MQQIEVGRIADGSLWIDRKSGKYVRVAGFGCDPNSGQDRVLYADEDGATGEMTLQTFWMRHKAVPPEKPEPVPEKVADETERGSGY